ncbi:MAG TPA: CHASE2 domain-containing protein [Tepidisphaeraceae bacterium]|jgi:hypothetical protein|nr:CHASE2 domain-containing protein [Tepidisphaeraceae bacterium]
MNGILPFIKAALKPKVAIILAAAFIVAAASAVFVRRHLRSVPPRESRTSNPAAAIPSVDPFVVVFIDDKTEARLGPFPYDRAVYGKAVDVAADEGARAVVVKFFLDKPKTAIGDEALARAMTRIPVVLQARIDDSESDANELPDRFVLNFQPGEKWDVYSGQSGWIPLPLFSRVGADVGFIDIRALDSVPLVERYRGKYVKSLFLSCLEAATGEKTRFAGKQSVQLGSRRVQLNDHGESAASYPDRDDMPSISFADFVDRKPHASMKDRVVIIAYDSSRFEAIDTPMGKVRPHRVFYYALGSLYRSSFPAR